LVARYLITTADERTWKFDRPVLFLGEWCRQYNRKSIWQKMDAVVASPYGLGQAKKDKDFTEARALEEKLFPILCDLLNQYHGTRHGSRFWKIILGHWFSRFIDVILNRVRTLEQCLQAYQLSGTSAFADGCYSLATMDSISAIWAFSNDRWNNALYIRILNLLEVTSCPVQVISDDLSESFQWTAMASEVPPNKKILKWSIEKVKKLPESFVRENDAFIINSYLPLKEEIKLQLALGQVPQLWRSPKLKFAKSVDRDLRRQLSNQIGGKSNETLYEILSTIVFELLPVCYLEGFTEISETVKLLPWPKRPKFIFTSNNFDFDEIFKFWVAAKVESGFKYITGQHGNNYGTHRYLIHLTEETTPDKFLTWGWEDGLPQHTPAFVFKIAGHTDKAYNPNGGLLLIELHAAQMFSTWDDSAEFNSFFDDQQNFIGRLQKQIKKELIVRLHHGSKNLKWDEEARWKDFDPCLKIDTGEEPIYKLTAQSRLVIHSYDSTGILETLSQNIPTLAFWQNGFDHLRDSAKPYYKMLVDAGIVHLTPESAAAKVNSVWDNVDGWWAQSNVQETRKQFCNRYARVSQNPSRNLKNILKKCFNDVE